MPDYGNPFEPEPPTHLPDATPSGVRALGAAGLLLAICGMLALPWDMLQFYRGAWTRTPEGLGGAATWFLIASILGVALSVLLLIGSIGCWSLRPWARGIMILFGILSVVAGAVGSIYFIRWFLSARQTEQIRGVSSCCLVMSWPIGTVFGAYVLFYMTRPAVKAVFKLARTTGLDEEEQEETP